MEGHLRRASSSLSLLCCELTEQPDPDSTRPPFSKQAHPPHRLSPPNPPPFRFPYRVGGSEPCDEACSRGEGRDHGRVELVGDDHPREGHSMGERKEEKERDQEGSSREGDGEDDGDLESVGKEGRWMNRRRRGRARVEAKKGGARVRGKVKIFNS